MTTETTETTETITPAAARAATFDSVAASFRALDASAPTVGLVYAPNLPGAHSLAASALMHLLFCVDHERALAFFQELRSEP